MAERILWSSISRFHNWRDRRFPLRLVEQAVACGLVGAVEWAQVGPDGPRRQVRLDDTERLGLQLFRLVPIATKRIYLEVGGSVPHEWSLSMLVPPFDEREGRVEGYNIINIRFPLAQEESGERSAELIRRFTETHTPEDTEFAFIHPEASWDALRMKAYSDPVTYSPMFAGVFWANFFGPGHLDQFDPGALESLDAYKVERVGDRGLFLIVSPNVLDVKTSRVEREMNRLTEIFRTARK